MAHHRLLTHHISKTHFSISSLNVRELELSWCSKDQARKMGRPPAWEKGVDVQLPPAKH